ncbi:MAG TPA: hypothetical protein PLS34_12365, partial [Gammaproteobacteria bacterium]|nr:hypothetical protein [Gammaproteobacteria bacterium]
VATISAEKSRSVRMAIEPGRVVLTVRNMEAGQAVEELEIDYSGEPFELYFSPIWLEKDRGARIADGPRPD